MTITYRDLEHHKKVGYSDKQRVALARLHKALPDGSFPIVTRVDLANAIASYGRSKHKRLAKAHIIRRAEEMRLTKILPIKWQRKK